MEQILIALEEKGCDISGGLKRFMNNEAIYLKYLNKFPEEKTMSQFIEALNSGDYECAAQEIHTFKGITGNLGLTELFELSKEMMVLLKENEYEKAERYAKKIETAYETCINIIRETR
ncbi:MAG: Hpt domain-containing protein [Eubacterium sp.]